jgi:hypothetical protein
MCIRRSREPPTSNSSFNSSFCHSNFVIRIFVPDRISPFEFPRSGYAIISSTSTFGGC